jgi:hypothetical protein
MTAPVLDRPQVPARRPARPRRRTQLIGLLTLFLLVVVAVVAVRSIGDRAGPAGTPAATDEGTALGTTGRLDPADPPLATLDGAFARSGDGLLLVGGWLGEDSQGTVARYAEGGWLVYPTPPEGCCFEIALGADGVVYGHGLGEVFALVDGIWAPLPKDGSPPGRAWRIATDPGTGVLWVSTHERLFRWDGETWTAAPPCGHSRLPER